MMRTPRQRLAATLEHAASAPRSAVWEATARDLMRSAATSLRDADTDLRLTAQRAVDATAREADLRLHLSAMLAPCAHWSDGQIAGRGPITLTFGAEAVVLRARAALRGEQTPATAPA